MNPCLFVLYYFLSTTIHFCYGQDGDYCLEYNELIDRKLSDLSFSLVDNMRFPTITEIVDESVLLEQNDSIEMIYKQKPDFPTSVLFFSIGDVAKIIVKKPPGNIVTCKGYRYHPDSYKYQKFRWTPSRVCSFTISDFDSDYFGKWIIETYFKLDRNAPQVKIQTEVFYLMNASKNDNQAPYIIRNDELQISDRVIHGVKIKMYRRLGTDRGIAIKPQIPSKIYNNRSVRKCEAIHYDWPGNKTYHLAPQVNFEKTLTSLNYTGRFYTCEFIIPVLEEIHLGRWDIITYFNDTNNYKNGLTKQIDTVEIHELKKLPTEMSERPKNNFDAYAGTFVLINHLNECYLEKDKINKCKLIDKRTQVEYILTENDREMQLVGKCGVRMRVLRNNFPDQIDYWRLEGIDSNGDVLKTLDFAITIFNHRQIFFRRHHYVKSKEGWNVAIGQDHVGIIWAAKKKLISLKDLLHCELEFSNGTILSLMKSNFTYTFNGITLSDFGTSTLLLSFKKSVKVQDFLFVIRINGSENIAVTEFLRWSKKYITFKFNSNNTENTAKFCQLKFLNDNSKLTELQIEYKDERCEFIFNNLTNFDNGLWKFSINYENGFIENYKMMIKRHVKRNEAQYRIDTKNTEHTTHVMFGDKFMMDCSQNVPLEFCRFKNPVNLIYPITNKTLLNAGKCEITVESANHNHNGTWSCEVGYRETIPTKIITFDSKFDVTIHNAQLALDIYMNPWESRTSASISCDKVEHVYPTNGYLDGCWWTHPDGRSIISQNSKNHTIVYNQQTCEITLNRLYKQDFGRWNCSREYVMPDSRVTLSNSVELVEKYGMILVQKYVVSCYIKFGVYTIGPTNAINCQVLPPENMYIRSCNWIRPDNTSLFPYASLTARDEKYNSSVMIPHHPDTCGLRFYVAAAEDIGNWTCLINLTNSYTDIITGRINFPKPAEKSFITEDNVPFFVLGGALLVIIIFLAIIYGITLLVPRYLDARNAKMAAESSTESVVENTSRQNLRSSLKATSRRIEGRISRRNLEQNGRLNQQRLNTRRVGRERQSLEQNQRLTSETRRQARTHVNPGPESLTARRAACPDNVYIRI